MKTLFIRIGLFMILVTGLLGIQANNLIVAKEPEHSPPPALLMWGRIQHNEIDASQGVRSVVFDQATPGLVLASGGSGGGTFFRSNDSGKTWTTLPFVPIDTRATYGLAYSSTLSFLAYSQVGLYKTADAGTTWTPLPSPPLCNGITTLMVHPTETNTIYAGTPQGFSRSLDGGQTWETFGEFGCASPIATSFGVGVDEPNVVYAGQLYDRDGGGVQRSNDRGATWTPVSTGLPFSDGTQQNHVSIKQLAVDPRDADTVFARTEAGLIYTTTNGGALWTPLSAGLNNLKVGSLYYDTKHAYRLYATTDYALYYLDDGSSSWVKYPTLALPQYLSSPDPWNIVVDPFDEDNFILQNGISGMVRSLVVASRIQLPLLQK